MTPFDITVTSAADDGAGSLRDAIRIAEANADVASGATHARIIFGYDIDNDYNTNPSVITLSSALRVSTGDIRIYSDVSNGQFYSYAVAISGDTNGDGARNAGDSQLLIVESGATVTLDGMRLQEGFHDATGANPPNRPSADAYAIYNNGDLTIRDSVIADTLVRSSDSGDLTETVTNSGTMRIFETAFDRNRVESVGAAATSGVFNEQTLQITRSGFTGDAIGNAPTTNAIVGVYNFGVGALSGYRGSAIIGYNVAGANASPGIAGRAHIGLYDAGAAAAPFQLAISGSGDDDSINGPGGAILLGLAGDDTLTGGGGDLIFGGAGEDEITIGGGAGQTAFGGGGGDTIVATDTAGHKTYGDEGRDKLRIEGATPGTIEFFGGGGDGDSVDFGQLFNSDGGAPGLTFDLRNAANEFVAGSTLVLDGVEQLYGSVRADTVTGSAGADAIFGGGGADRIFGGGGVDRIRVQADGANVFGGAEYDYLSSRGNGSATLNGGGGGDFFYVYSSASGQTSITVTGGSGADTLSIYQYVYSQTGSDPGFSIDLGRSGAQQVTSNLTITLTGVEDVSGSGRADRLIGTGADETLRGGAGDDTISAGGGDDRIAITLSGAKSVFGGADDDQLTAYLPYGGGISSGVVSGGSGVDYLYAPSYGSSYGPGRDVNVSLARQGAPGVVVGAGAVIYGFENLGSGSGDDTLTGDGGANRIYSSGGANVVAGGGGNDFVRVGYYDYGQGPMVNGAAADRLFGGAGNDTLLGGGGADMLTGGTGVNILNGGGGADQAIFAGARASFEIARTGDGLIVAGGGETSTLISVETLVFTDGAVTAAAAAAAAPFGLATPGDDDITGTAGADRINALAGDDRVRGLGGRDELIGGPGQDTLLGGGGKDKLKGGAAKDVLKGQGGADNLIGGGGGDRLVGGGGRDKLKGGGGADKLNGGGGNDRLVGGGGKDTLKGGAGADTLIGGAKDDLLIGGGGADTIIFAGRSGSDVIRGFQQGVDVIDVKGAANFAALTIEQEAGGARISFAGGDVLAAGQSADAFSEADFKFRTASVKDDGVLIASPMTPGDEFL